MRFFFVIILLLFSLSLRLEAQVGNNVCEGALPFCTGTNYTFPAGVNAGSGQAGPYYACLTTTPNPAWYYMKIATPGMIQITMYSVPSRDIDFCLWGPFDTQDACNQLTSAKVVDCSYSVASTEYVDIPNAVQGKYYILIITNYSNQPCNIIFSQTAGTGTTDCTILPPAASSNGPICVGETLRLWAASMNNATYHWIGPDGWTSTVQNPTRPNAQLSMAGIYSLWVTVNGVPSADTNHTTVNIFNPPTASLSGGGSVCEGDSLALTISCQNHPPWNVTYTTNGQSPRTVAVSHSPYHLWVKPSANTTYALTQVSNEVCSGAATGSAYVQYYPKPVVNFSNTGNCSGYATHFYDNSTISGGSISTWHWDFGTGCDTSNIQNPVFTYVDGGTYNVLLQVKSNQGCGAAKLKQVIISPTPVANAGPDQSIPYGTNTQLNGTVTGGSGSYSYNWEPAALLVNPDILNPSTVNLTSTTDFALTATDGINGCIHSDHVTVTVTGGAMQAQVSAQPGEICRGASAFLNVQAGGGSGNYSYQWTSNPPGFTSTMEDVTVQPLTTTTYYVQVSDGFSFVTQSTVVTVYDNPAVNAGNDKNIPFGTSTTLSGTVLSGYEPYIYSWSPAELVVSPSQASTLTAILTTSSLFTLTVTDGHGCVSSDQVQVSLTGGPLMVNPRADQSPVCCGESTFLRPMSEGGSGSYTYTWSANGNMFSHDSVVRVTPSVTTTYRLQISDGYTTSQGEVTVAVNPLPVVNLIPANAHVLSTDTMAACVFDTITLDATNASSVYLWSNGAVTPSIHSATSGITFDMLSYSVTVLNTLTGCSNSGIVTIMFTYGECSYGFGDRGRGEGATVYPNPGLGVFRCSLVHGRTYDIEIFNMEGVRVQNREKVAADLYRDGITIDLTTQPAGVYLMKLRRNDSVTTLRIIKQ